MKFLLTSLALTLLSGAALADSPAIEKAIEKASNDKACAMEFGDSYKGIADIAWKELEHTARAEGMKTTSPEFKAVRAKVLQRATLMSNSTLLGEYCEPLLRSGS